MNDLYSKIVPGSSASREAFGQFNDAHTTLDSELPAKLEPSFEKAVLEPVSAWEASLEEIKNDLKTVEEKRVIFDHYRCGAPAALGGGPIWLGW